MMQIFQFLAVPLGYAMRWLYMLLQNYGWSIILFTLVIRVLMFPLSLKQQKSTARTNAYQPMIQEIQKKWANDKNRQNQELQKFQEENNIKMTAGCLPTIVNMLVLFGIIAVIQAPLTYILRVPTEQIADGVAIVEHYDPEMNITKNAYTQQSLLIGQIRSNPEEFIDGVDVEGEDGKTTHVAMDAETVQQIQDFKFDFAGLNLARVPSFNDFSSLILPILSVLTMFGSQIIIMFTSGQTQGRGTMWIITLAMGAFFGWYAFTIPVGFSLYYTASNVIMTGQQLIVRRIYDPKKIREEIEREIEERKRQKKSKKKVAVTTADGAIETKEMTDAELAQARLAYARMLDAKRYEAEDAQDDALEKALEQDAQKYSKNPTKNTAKKKEAPEKDAGKIEEETEENPAIETETETEQIAEKQQQPKQPAKPGRRKRARQNKENTEEKSFAEREQDAEQKSEK